MIPNRWLSESRHGGLRVVHSRHGGRRPLPRPRAQRMCCGLHDHSSAGRSEMDQIDRSRRRKGMCGRPATQNPHRPRLTKALSWMDVWVVPRSSRAGLDRGFLHGCTTEARKGRVRSIARTCSMSDAIGILATAGQQAPSPHCVRRRVKVRTTAGLHSQQRHVQCVPPR